MQPNMQRPIFGERSLEIRSPKVAECRLVTGQRAVVRLGDAEFHGIVLELDGDLLRFRADDEVGLEEAYIGAPPERVAIDGVKCSAVRLLATFPARGLRICLSDGYHWARQRMDDGRYDDWEVVEVSGKRVYCAGDDRTYTLDEFDFGPRVDRVVSQEGA